jgi:hypothetical protein
MAKQTNQTLTPDAIRKPENSKHSDNSLHNRIDKTLFSWLSHKLQKQIKKVKQQNDKTDRRKPPRQSVEREH